jgi:dTDP-4-amino-4,6-dideoxygalactose transaminase
VNDIDMESPIAPLDLAAERAQLGAPLEEAVLRVLRSGQYVLGPEVAAFEASFAELCGAKRALGVSSGTDALVLALRALGVGPGDRVLTSPFTFFASAGAIAWIGATPVLADIDPGTALLTPEIARAAIESSTEPIRCLLPVHLYGQLCDMRGFRALADEKGIALLEDAAQAHGATRDGVRAGELGDAAAFSFYPTKNLGAAGEGGAITVRTDALGDATARLRDHGMSAKYRHASIGTNSRLHAMQAAVLNVKLPYLAEWNGRRRVIAAQYDAALAGIDGIDALTCPSGSVPSYHQYAVRVTADMGRDGLQARLAERAISAAVHYPLAVHQQEAAADWELPATGLPEAERLAAQVLCLPVHPFLSDEEVDRISTALKQG